MTAATSDPRIDRLYDLLPAICELTGAPLPQDRNLCGRSYLPAALNKPFPKKNPWRNLVFGEFRNTFMARDTRYKLVLRDDGKGPNELYDLRKDPQERVNQYENAEYLTVRTPLSESLRQWREKTV